MKELRVRKINSREATNAFAPYFTAQFNTGFAKVPLRESMRGDRCAPIKI